jgi:hypothetical protein
MREQQFMIPLSYPDKIKAKLLYDLESLLSTPDYYGIPLGSTLGSLFFIYYYTSSEKWTYKSILADYLRYIKYRFFMPEEDTSINIAKLLSAKGKIALTLSHKRDELTELVLPIANLLPKDSFYILADFKDINDIVPPEMTCLFVDDLVQINSDTWKKSYIKKSRVWHKNISTFFKKNNIPTYAFWKIALYLLVQAKWTYVCKRFINEFRPMAILTDFDRNIFTAPFVLTARLANIPTATMIHGVINPPYVGYVPLLADYAFCWGQEQKDMMIMAGTDPNKLIITGCQRFQINNTVKYKQDCPSLKIKSDQIMVTLGTSPIDPSHRRKLVHCFCNGISKISRDLNVVGVIRLHPSEVLRFYSQEIKDYPYIRFTSNKAFSKGSILGWSDIVVSRDSGFGNDAILANKPVIILDPIGTEMGNGSSLIKNAGCPLVQTVDELANIIRKFIINNEYHKLQMQKAENYKGYFCNSYGSEAALNVVSEFSHIIQRAKKL